MSPEYPQSLSRKPDPGPDGAAPVIVFAAYKKLSRHPRVLRLCAEARALGWRTVIVGLGPQSGRTLTDEGDLLITLTKPQVEPGAVAKTTLPVRAVMKAVRLASGLPADAFGEGARVRAEFPDPRAARLASGRGPLGAMYTAALSVESGVRTLAEHAAQGALGRPLGALSIELFARRAARAALAESPDLLVAHDTYGLAIARAARRMRPGLPIGYDMVETLFGRRPARPPSALSRAVLRSLEGVARSAEFVWSGDPWLTQDFKRRHPAAADPVEVLNAPLPGRESARPVTLHQLAGLAQTAHLAVYAGLIAPSRELELFVDAVARLPERFAAVILGPEVAPSRRRLEAYIARRGLEGRIRVIDPLPEDELVDALKSAHVGVSPMAGPAGSNVRCILTNKVFQYLGAGLPQTAARSTAAASFIEGEGVGVAFPDHDAAGLADTILQLDAQRETFQPAINQALGRHAWSAQAVRVRATLEGRLEKMRAGEG